MIEVVVNPPDMEPAYRAGLDACFPGAWTDPVYRWFLQRPFGERRPDLLGVKDGGTLVAGLGVNYRQLAVPGGDILTVGILTAAWTLPRERGRWHMSRLVRAALQCGELRGCGAMLAFVTRENTSAAVLKYMGASTVPTFYLHASAAATIANGALPDIEPCAMPAERRPPPRSGEAVRFHYATDRAWHAQFLDRPYPTRALRVGDAVAVIEETESADRVQFLSDSEDPPAALAALAKAAQQRGRELFHFTTSKALANAAERRGLELTPGYVTVMRPRRSTAGPVLTTGWEVQSGDRM